MPQGITLEALKRNHPSRPPQIRSLPIPALRAAILMPEAGHLKIINTCLEADLPEPDIKEQDGSMLVTLFKQINNKVELPQKGLNERQEKAVDYVGSAEKVKGRHKIRFIGNKRLFSEGFVVDKPLISAFSSKNFQSENRSARVLKVLCQKPCASIIKILLKHKLDQRFVLFQQTLCKRKR